MESFENSFCQYAVTVCTHFLESNKYFLFINTQSITRFPISDTIIITDTTPSPANNDDGRLVVSTVVDVL